MGDSTLGRRGEGGMRQETRSVFHRNSIPLPPKAFYAGLVGFIAITISFSLENEHLSKHSSILNRPSWPLHLESSIPEDASPKPQTRSHT